MPVSKTIPWGDGSGDVITVEAPAFSKDQKVSISSPENLSNKDRSKVITITSESDSSKVITINASQKRVVITYGLRISINVSNVPASGGTYTLTSYLITYKDGIESSETEVTPVYDNNGYSWVRISGNKITVSSRGTVEDNYARVFSISADYTAPDGSTVSANKSVSQLPNYKYWVNTEIVSFDYPEAPSDGGWVFRDDSVIQTFRFSSGETLDEEVDQQYMSFSQVTTDPGVRRFDAPSGTIVWDSNESLSSRQIIVKMTVKTPDMGYSISKNATSVQSPGVMTYGDLEISLDYPTIPASGGMSIPEVTFSLSWGWNGETTGGGVITNTTTSGYTYMFSGSGVDPEDGRVNAASKGTRVSGVTTVTTATVEVTVNGVSGEASAAVKQQENAETEIVYGVPSVTCNVEDIPASGGTISSGDVTYTQSRTQYYTSGSSKPLSEVSSGGTISYSAPVVAPSLEDTVKSRSVVGSITATVELNGVSGSSTVSVYQEANQYVEDVYDLPNFIDTVNVPSTVDMLNVLPYLGDLYLGKKYTSGFVKPETNVGDPSTYPHVITPELISATPGMTVNPSASMVIIGDNTTGKPRVAVIQYTVSNAHLAVTPFVGNLTINQD